MDSYENSRQRHAALLPDRLHSIGSLDSIIATDKVFLDSSGERLIIGRETEVAVIQLESREDEVKAEILYRHNCYRPLRALAVDRRDNVFAVLAGDQDGTSTLVRVVAEQMVEVADIAGEIQTIAATPRYLVATVAAHGLETASLVVLRPRDGRILSREPLKRAKVSLRTGSSDNILVVDKKEGQIRHINVARRCPPRQPDSRVPLPDPGPSKPPKPHGCCCTPDSKSDPDRRPPPRREPEDYCQPGDDGFPDGCLVLQVTGQSIVQVNICDPGYLPCETRLPWDVGDIARTPRTLLVRSQDGRRIAELDPNSLSVRREFSLGRHAVRMAASAASDRAVLFVPGSTTAFLLDASPPPAGPFAPAIGFADQARVYHGTSAKASWNSGGHQTGERRVLIIPIVEQGQGFSGSIDQYKDWLREPNGILEKVTAYFDEASYGRMSVSFTVVGADHPWQISDVPIELPEKFATYYHDRWDPGAVEAFAPLPAGNRLTFSGDEQMVLEATSGLRGTRDFQVRFPALSYRKRIDAAQTLSFDPAATARTITLEGEDRQGNTFTLDLTSAVISATDPDILINENTLADGSAADALADKLDEMTEEAAVTAGISNPFERPVVRWHDDGEDLGMLHITFSFAPQGEATQEPFVEVVPADTLMPEYSGSAIPAFFDTSANGTVPGLDTYFKRILADAVVDHSDYTNIKKPYFDFDDWPPQAEVDGGQLYTRINLSIDDGHSRPEDNIDAEITVTSQTGLAKLGMDSATPYSGVTFTYDKRNSLRDSKKFVDAAFTALIDAVLLNSSPEKVAIAILNDILNCTGVGSPLSDPCYLYHAFVFAFVDAPPHNFPGSWQTSTGEVQRLRGAARSVQMDDQKAEKRASPVLSVPNSRGQVIMALRSDSVPPPSLSESLSEDSAETLAHELGHKLLGLSDQYEEQGFRDDVLYVGTRDLMGDETGWPHLCAFHKLIKGWIDDDDVFLLDRPPSDEPIQDLDVVLVQLDHYNPDWSEGEKSALLTSLPNTPDGTPVHAAVFLRLGGDGRIFDTLELRGKTAQFSQTLDPPRIVMINAIDYEDDTRYAEGEEADPIEVPHIYRYRRKLHLLTDEELQVPGDDFEFENANEFIEVGLTVEVMEWGQANVGGNQVELTRVRINWIREPSIELGFTESSPTWQSPDIGIDAPPDYRDVDVGFPIGQPTDQGEPLRIPSQGENSILHRVFVRVWNFGEEDASNVQVQLLKRDMGAGDKKHKFVHEWMIPSFPGDSPQTLAYDWNLEPIEEPHFCWMAAIGDRDFPPGVNDDTTEKNNSAQQNVFEFPVVAESPPAPLHLTYRVHNTGPLPELAVPQPHGMPEGVTLRVSPGRAIVPVDGSRLFRLTIEVAEEYLHRLCGKDIDFRVETWRVSGESEERWGAVRYRLKPRLKTTVSINGYWVFDEISIFGGIDPDVSAGVVHLHIHPAGEADFWRTINLGPGATYTLDLDGTEFSGSKLVATARYDGSLDHAAAVSEVLHLKRTDIG